MKLWIPLGWSFSSTMVEYVRCMTYTSICIHLWWRGVITISHIGPSVTNNFLFMIFALQLMSNFQHPCKMKWKINIRTVTLCLMKNSVNSCPPWRRNIIENELRLKSKNLQLLRQRRPIMIVMHQQRWFSRVSQGLMSYRSEHKHKGYQSYFMLCKKSGMPERKYKSHSS